jgi:hypothetical protein
VVASMDHNLDIFSSDHIYRGIKVIASVSKFKFQFRYFSTMEQTCIGLPVFRFLLWLIAVSLFLTSGSSTYLNVFLLVLRQYGKSSMSERLIWGRGFSFKYKFLPAVFLKNHDQCCMQFAYSECNVIQSVTDHQFCLLIGLSAILEHAAGS